MKGGKKGGTPSGDDDGQLVDVREREKKKKRYNG